MLRVVVEAVPADDRIERAVARHALAAALALEAACLDWSTFETDF